MIIRGGKVVTPTGLNRADIVVGEDGRIAAVISAGIGRGYADTGLGAGAGGPVTIDASGLLVLPGMIDAHVHFDEPGRTEWEGFDTGSAAAVAGGVTTVVDMPIDCHPPTTTAAAVAAKALAAQTSSRVDVALWGGLVPDSVAKLGEMLDAGVAGFKAFACPSGWDDFPPADSHTLAAGFAAAALAGVPVAVHCELAGLGHTSGSEVAAVRWAGQLAQQAGARLHVVHVSSAEAVDEGRRWPGVTIETCPHYLFFDDNDAARIGAAAHCFPPIRDGANREALWGRVLNRAVDSVASDHSPCPPGLRVGAEPWAGIDGIGMALPLLFSAGRLAPWDIVRLMTAAARILRLPGKGAIAPGFDADMVLFDPDGKWTVSVDDVYSRHRCSPYLGSAMQGRVKLTMVRGRIVFSADSGPGDAGGGRFIRPVLDPLLHDPAIQPVLPRHGLGLAIGVTAWTASVGCLRSAPGTGSGGIVLANSCETGQKPPLPTPKGGWLARTGDIARVCAS